MRNNVIVVGSNSIHLQRYIKGIAHTIEQIIFITNNLDNLILPANVKPYVINFSLFNLRAAWQIAKILRQYAIGTPVIHIHQANSYAFHTICAIKLLHLKCRVILTTWGSDILILPHKNYLLKKMVQFNLKNSHEITADSLYVMSEIQHLCPTAMNVHYIVYGLDNFPDHLDTTMKENIILSNRLHKSLYNIDKIILAFAKLSSKYNMQLVITATGDQTQELQALVAKSNIQNVIFTGMLPYDQLIQWYQKAKIFVSIPQSDATSQSLLEAMAYGCYPIVSNLPANRQWITNAKNGLINMHPEELCADLEQAINMSNKEYSVATEFNYKLMDQQARFSNNIQRFITLLQDD